MIVLFIIVISLCTDEMLAEEFEEEEEEEEDDDETEEDATDRMRNDLEDIFDKDTNALATVQVRVYTICRGQDIEDVHTSVVG